MTKPQHEIKEKCVKIDEMWSQTCHLDAKIQLRVPASDVKEGCQLLSQLVKNTVEFQLKDVSV